MQDSVAAQKAKARARHRSRASAPTPDNVVRFAPPPPLELTAADVIHQDLDDAPFEPPPADDILGLNEIDEEETLFAAAEAPVEVAAEGAGTEAEAQVLAEVEAQAAREADAELEVEAEAEAEPEAPPYDDDAPFDPPEFDDEPVFTAPASVQLEGVVTHTPKPDAPKQVAPRQELAAQRDRLLPAISIHASWDSAEAETLLTSLAADPRFARAEMEIARGGLGRAVARAHMGETPDLFIVETALHGGEMLAGLDRLRAAAPKTRIVVIAGINDISLLRELAARGVSDYIVPPAKADDVARSLCALFADADGARVIAVIGARGGVGASTIAHNLAWSIAERQGVRTTLADFDLSFGAATFNFQQSAETSIADVLEAGEDADEVVTRALTKLTPRLQLLAAPDRVLPADLDVDAFEQTLAEVRRTASCVVLDLPHLWEPWVRRALCAADDVVIVASPDLASLRNADNMLKLLRSERDQLSTPKVVLSMVGVPKRPEIPLKDFAEAVCVQPLASFAFEPELFGRASERGEMIYEAMPDAKAALQLDTLASTLTAHEAVLQPAPRAKAAPKQAAEVEDKPVAETETSKPSDIAPAQEEPLLLNVIAEAPRKPPRLEQKRRAARTGFLALQAPSSSRRRSSGLVRTAVAVLALAGAFYAQHQRSAAEAQTRQAIEVNATRV